MIQGELSRAIQIYTKVLQQPPNTEQRAAQEYLALARERMPDVILMDEPCSALDPIATAKIEELIDELREQVAEIRGDEVDDVGFERLLEAPARLWEASAEVVDYTQPIEHVGVTEPLLHELLVIRLRKRVFSAVVVLVRRV